MCQQITGARGLLRSAMVKRFADAMYKYPESIFTSYTAEPAWMLPIESFHVSADILEGVETSYTLTSQPCPTYR